MSQVNYLQSRIQLEEVITTGSVVEVFNCSSTDIADHLCQSHCSLEDSKKYYQYLNSTFANFINDIASKK